MDNSVCIIGVGAVTPVGLNAPAAAAAVRAGIAAFHEHPYMINRLGDPYVLAVVPFLDSGGMGSNRYIRMTLPAAKEALDVLSGIQSDAIQVNVQIGLPENRPGFPGDLQARLLEEVRKIKSASYQIADTQFIVKGHCGGMMAIEAASRQVLTGSCEFCLAGGVDSYIDPDTLDWVEGNEQLHILTNAWGFIPGEAASFCLLCNSETANKYNISVRMKLIALSTALEKSKIKSETICTGKGLTQAVRECLKEIPALHRIDFTICDQNGEAYRADEYGFMLARLSNFFADPSDFMAPADCWGDVGAASGPLFVNLAVAAAEKGYAKGPYTLLWTSSEGGERSAALVFAEKKEREIN